MAANNTKKTSFRTTLDYILLLIAIVLGCFLLSKIYNIYKDSNLNVSVLERTVGTIQVDDLENAKSEFMSDNFILISFTKSKENRKIEKNIKKIITEKNLQDNFYYLDATELMLEDNYIANLNKKFNLSGNNKIETLPAIIYYKNKEVTKVLNNNYNGTLLYDEFAKLLDEYEINNIESY